jgi:hypothetical protein
MLPSDFSAEVEQQTRNSILCVACYVLVRRLLQSNYKRVDRSSFCCGQMPGVCNTLTGEQKQHLLLHADYSFETNSMWSYGTISYKVKLHYCALVKREI